MNNEQSLTPTERPTGSNAFGLYLILGMVLALLVVGVYGYFDEGRDEDAKERAPRATITQPHTHALPSKR